MNITKKILKILFWMILIIIVIYSTTIIFQKIVWKDKTPNFMGYKNFIILTGSMEPTLNPGDIIFVKETTNINEQDIISFKVENAIVTHRVVEIEKRNDKNLYITKGDANSGNDTELISIESVEGKYAFKIPLLGNIILFFQGSVGIAVLVIILIIILIRSYREPKHMKGSDSNKGEKSN